MPKNLIDAETWVANVQAATDGDVANEANLSDLAPQHLANRTAYLRPGVPGRAASYRLGIPLLGFAVSTSDWAWHADDIPVWKALTNTQINLWLRIPVPPVGKLDEVHVRITGAAGHAGQPGTMPLFIAQNQGDAISGGDESTNDTLGTANDVWSSAAAYQAPHTISLTGLNHTINTGRDYYVRFRNEAGANALAGLLVLRAWAIIIP